MKTSRLFFATAVIEAATGFALLVAPGVVVGLLIGASIDSPSGAVIARVAALAMISIAIACWFARSDEQSGGSRGLLFGLLFYNSAVALLLVHASLGLHLSAIGLWPAAILHAAFAAWCVKAAR